MVADTPLESRCAARITDKVGLELHMDDSAISGADQEVLSDDSILIVRLTSADGSHTVDAEPDYQVVREYRWNDYTPTAIAVSPDTLETLMVDGPIPGEEDAQGADESDPTKDRVCPEDWPDIITLHGAGPDALADAISTAGTLPEEYHSDDSALIWATLGEGVDTMTNAGTTHQGYCERYPMDNGRCYNHQPGPGAPEPGVNALEHGLYAQRTTFYKALQPSDKQFVEALVDSWLEQSPYDRDNVAVLNELYRCGIDQLRAWSGIEEFVEDGETTGLLTEQPMTDDDGNPVTDSDGNEITVDTEDPANLPYSRLDRDVQSKLKNLSVYEDADSQQADATESLAQALSNND